MKSATQTVEVVSTVNPSGVTFLLNILVELKFLIFTSSFRHFWSVNSLGQAKPNYLLVKKFGVWMPALLKHKVFHASDVNFYWSHEWPRTQPASSKRILFVRDPRDTLFSQYKRVRSTSDINSFLKSKSYPFDLDRMDMWALQNLLWLDLSRREDLLVIKFEDIKANPLETIKTIFSFCGTYRNDTEIEAAIAESSTEKVKLAHDKIRKQFDPQMTKSREVIRKGESFEWKKDLTRSDLHEYNSRGVNRAIELFGYEKTAHAHDTAKVVEVLEAFHELYGSKRNFSSDQVARMTETLKLFDLKTKANFLCLVQKKQLRLLVFRIGINVANFVRTLTLVLCPPIARLVERFVVNYSLGEK